MTDFRALGLAEPLLQALDRAGQRVPTPIQAAAIPAILLGRDLQGIAPTGTGKTAAFALPILHRLLASHAERRDRCCRVLALAPTRELAAQTATVLRAYARHIGPRVAVLAGGVPKAGQARALAGGVEVVVATPGRLLDHLGDGALRLDDATILVLDEADRMLDLGFADDVRRIAALLPRIRQTLLFSATMPPAIAALARDLLHRPVLIDATPAAAVPGTGAATPTADASPAGRIDQRVIFAEPRQKRPLLIELLRRRGTDRTLVFTRTRQGADDLVADLDGAGIRAAAIHGDKSQAARDRALLAFRSGRLPVLVATDVAARGIDVDGLGQVINYDLPDAPETYVHRIGRTGRAGGRGIAITLCGSAERQQLRAIERLTGARIKVHEADAGAGRRG